MSSSKTEKDSWDLWIYDNKHEDAHTQTELGKTQLPPNISGMTSLAVGNTRQNSTFLTNHQPDTTYQVPNKP